MGGLQSSCSSRTKARRLALVAVAVAATAAAQTLTTLYTFTGGSDGGGPKGQLVQGPDGNFYGTTSGPGTVFKITPGGAITTLHNFTGPDGVGSFGGLVFGKDGNLYGTTTGGTGGATGGTVFRITPTGSFTTLHSFNVLDGNSPWGALTLGSDGNFYGTTTSGGTNAAGQITATGTIFQITPGGALTTLHVFNLADGADPVGALVQGSDGAFYGTTGIGGSAGIGTVFKITSAGVFTSLHSFTGTDGQIPWGTLVQGSDGAFYGTATLGGAFSLGTVFKITSTGTFTTLHSFNGADGAGPLAGLTLGSDGNFYGTTQIGAPSTQFGTIFKITPGGAFSLLYSFSGTDGSFPFGDLTLGSDGNFYGTTDGGGKNGAGTVFELNVSGAGSGGTQAPSVAAGGVVSASAYGQFHSIAPGTWIEIYGTNLAAHSRMWAASDFNGVNAPTSLDGTSVTIGGQSAFVDYISSGQVNVQVPSNVGTGPQQLIVTTAAGPSTPYTVTVNATQPGLLAPFNVGGKQYVGALFLDNATYAMPPGAVAGVPSRRAQAGDYLTFYGIGFGTVAPDSPAGQIVQQNNSLTLPFSLFFGQTQAQVSYDGLAPGAVGLYQFDVMVPAVPASDTVPVSFTLGGTPGTQTLYIAVQ